MLNSQPSILGQQPHAVAGPGMQQYSGAQFVPAHGGYAPPSAGWSTGVTPAPHSMPGQMHNPHFMPPASMGYESGHSMMHPNNQNGFPPAGSMARYPPQ